MNQQRYDVGCGCYGEAKGKAVLLRKVGSPKETIIKIGVGRT